MIHINYKIVTGITMGIYYNKSNCTNLKIYLFIYLCIELGNKIKGGNGFPGRNEREGLPRLDGGIEIVAREGGAETHGTNILVTLASLVFLREV